MHSADASLCGLLDKRTYTHASAGVEIEPRFTDASEAPIFIDAQSIEAHVPDQTLIQVCGQRETKWFTLVYSSNTRGLL